MAGALDAFNINRRNAQADTQGLFDQQVMRQAGGLLAGGNYNGAAGALYGGGLLEQGAQVQAMGQAQTDRADRRKAAEQAKAAEIDAAEQAERLKFLSQAGTVLLSIPADKRAQAYTQSIAPALKAMGATDEVIQQAGADLSDATLQTFTGQVNKQLEQFTLSPGSARYDNSGRLIASQPFAPEYKSVSPGETLVEVGGSGAPAAGGSALRSERNNNPGNIEDGDFAKSLPGYKGSDGRFAIFETPEAGANAQTALLSSYGKRGFDTVEEIINRWAPPSDNNPTSAYVDFVAKKLGVQPGDKLNMTNPETLRSLAGAIKQFEGGGQSASNSSGARVIAQGAPKPDMTPAQTRKAEADLRKEFNGLPDVKEFNDVANSFNTISRLASGPPSGASDISFIFSYMKMLDPGSVVREGEFATAAKSGGVPDQVRNLYNRVINGERLTPAQRQDFVAQARNVYESRKTRYDQLVGQYQGYAEDYGLRPEVIQARIEAGSPAPVSGGGRQEGWTNQLPEAQRRASMRFKGSTGRAGSDANPFVPKSEAEYNKLPKGAVYIHSDGSLRTKGGG